MLTSRQIMQQNIVQVTSNGKTLVITEEARQNLDTKLEAIIKMSSKEYLKQENPRTATFLHIAAFYVLPKTAKALLEICPELVNTINEFGETPEQALQASMEDGRKQDALAYSELQKAISDGRNALAKPPVQDSTLINRAGAPVSPNTTPLVDTPVDTPLAENHPLGDKKSRLRKCMIITPVVVGSTVVGAGVAFGLYEGITALVLHLQATPCLQTFALPLVSNTVNTLGFSLCIPLGIIAGALAGVAIMHGLKSQGII